MVREKRESRRAIVGSCVCVCCSKRVSTDAQVARVGGTGTKYSTSTGPDPRYLHCWWGRTGGGRGAGWNLEGRTSSEVRYL